MAATTAAVVTVAFADSLEMAHLHYFSLVIVVAV